jgi:hypothetical protein
MTWDQWEEAFRACRGLAEHRQLLLEWADWCQEGGWPEEVWLRWMAEMMDAFGEDHPAPSFWRIPGARRGSL